MRTSILVGALTLVGAFTLAACNDDTISPGAPIEVDFDVDGKTKTVTVNPTLTPPPYRPLTTTQPTAKSTAARTVTPTRRTTR